MSAPTPVRGVPDAPFFSSCDGCRQLVVYFCPIHAAAPRMLASLKELLFTTWALANPDQVIVREARAILRDVEGESNG